MGRVEEGERDSAANGKTLSPQLYSFGVLRATPSSDIILILVLHITRNLRRSTLSTSFARNGT